MEHFPLMARFNAWVNTHIYDCVGKLDEAEYRSDQGLFFGSIHNTLNHLLLGDRVWTARVQGIEHGINALNQILFPDLASLRKGRVEEDKKMIALMDRLSPADLMATRRYRLIDGSRAMEARVWDMLAGMFNHQTHHRGQITALLQQRGMKLPDIDLIYYLGETGQARFID
jgi:uncharacterized damage-inducible protein DinB